MLFMDLLDGADLVLFWEEEDEMWEVAEVGRGSREHYKLDTNTSTLLVSKDRHMEPSARFAGAWSMPKEGHDPEESPEFALFHFRFYKLKED